MSLSLLSNTLTFNGKVYKRAYDAATKTWSSTSAGGRQSTTLIDLQGRPLTSQTAGLKPMQSRYYEARGLLTKAGDLILTRDAQHGLLSASALGNTATALSYNGLGELASDKANINGDTVYDVSYKRDKLGRIIEKVETVDGTITTTVPTTPPGA